MIFGEFQDLISQPHKLLNSSVQNIYKNIYIFNSQRRSIVSLVDSSFCIISLLSKDTTYSSKTLQLIFICHE